MTTKEIFVDLQEKFNKVVKLMREDSKLDPDSEPFESQNSARQILIGMEATIENLIRNQSTDDRDSIKLTAMLAAVYLYMGLVSIAVKEISMGEKHLEKCKETIGNNEERPEMILITLNMYNQFGVLWSQREPEKSKVYFENAEQLYLKNKDLSVTPISFSDLFQVNIEKYNTECALRNLEKIHTNTLYYLAQIYKELKEASKTLIYFHNALQRQLQIGDYDPIEWVKDAANLSELFIQQDAFTQARHHLAASSYILEQHEKKLSAVTDRDTDFDAKMETFKYMSASVARCWTIYGLLLLEKSNEYIFNEVEDVDVFRSIASNFSNLQINPIVSRGLQNLYFEGIDVTAIESQVASNFVLTLDDAKKVFVNAQQWAGKAQEYYTSHNLDSDLIAIVVHQAQLYKNLLFFEDIPESEAKLDSRIVNLLESVLDKVNLDGNLQHSRHVWLQLADAYNDILKDILKSKMRGHLLVFLIPPPQSFSRINSLIDRIILHYSNFVNSFKDEATGKLPKKLPGDVEKQILAAHFHRGSLYGVRRTSDEQVRIQYLQLASNDFKYVCKYCKKFVVPEEWPAIGYPFCKRMLTSLPSSTFPSPEIDMSLHLLCTFKSVDVSTKV